MKQPTSDDPRLPAFTRLARDAEGKYFPVAKDDPRAVAYVLPTVRPPLKDSTLDAQRRFLLQGCQLLAADRDALIQMIDELKSFRDREALVRMGDERTSCR